MIKQYYSPQCLLAVPQRGKVCVLLVLILLMTACQAPLNLEAVNQEQGRATHRTDRFEAGTFSGTAIIVVGIGGVVLRSLDGGVSWNRTTLDKGASLIDAATCPDGTLAALQLENAVWISTDNGASWNRRKLQDELTPQAMTCDPLNRIWIVGGFSTILSSSDRAATWSRQNDGEDQLLTNIQLQDQDNGVATGEFGVILHTRTGGSDWASGVPLPGEFYPQDTLFVSEKEGRVVGLNGTILHTQDGGGSWSREVTETDAALYGLAKVGDAVYATGNAGTLLRLDEGGWRELDYGRRATGFLRVVLGIGNGKLLLAGDGGELQVVRLGQ